MAPNKSIELKGPNTLTRKIPYGRIPRGITVMELSREHLSMAYKGKEIN